MGAHQAGDIDLNLLLLNNAIYGLTKGQASPTSPIGTRSPSTPGGSMEQPVNAARFALGAGARFIARSADTLQDHLPGVLTRAHANRGASFVEILQNCIVYNDGAFGPINDKTVTPDATLRLEHGQPMIFGKEREKGLVLDGHSGAFRAVNISDAGADAIAVHDENSLARAQALALVTSPMLLGVICAARSD